MRCGDHDSLDIMMQEQNLQESYLYKPSIFWNDACLQLGSL